MSSPAAPSMAEVHAGLTAPGEPFEMADTTIRGIPTRVWKHAPTSLATILALSQPSLRFISGSVIFVDGGEDVVG